MVAWEGTMTANWATAANPTPHDTGARAGIERSVGNRRGA